MKNTNKNKKASSTKTSSQVEPHETVAVAAYYKAEHRSFQGGDQLHDWLEAEQEIKSGLEVALK